MVRRTLRTAVAVVLLSMLGIGWSPAPARALDQCVPFARALSGIALYGDAWRWWAEAAGRYGRSNVPQSGSVLSFLPNARMPLGHVAVVRQVISSREIEIDHANWTLPGAVSRSRVLDVSENNDWTTVRVELGPSDHFGSAYATNGFIYGRRTGPRPQIIDLAEALRAGSSGPQVVRVQEALRVSESGAQIVDVASFLHSVHTGEIARQGIEANLDYESREQ